MSATPGTGNGHAKPRGKPNGSRRLPPLTPDDGPVRKEAYTQDDGWTEKAIEVWRKMEPHGRALFHSDLWQSRSPSESVLDVVSFMHSKRNALGLTIDDLLSMATWADGFGMADYREFHLRCAREQWEVLNEKAQAEAKAKHQSGRLRILSVDELLARPPRDYLVKGWLSPNETSLLVGAKNARKSFTALHVGYGVAQGWRTIFGRRVHRAPVLYLIAEGEGGIGKRIKALVKRYGRCVDFHVIAQPIDLLRSTAEQDDLTDIIKLAKANGVRLIIVDTVNRALAGGDENGPTDMGILAGNLNTLRHETGAHVMGIHHGTWNDGTKSRGHSSLPASVEAIAQLTWSDEEAIGRLVLGSARDDITGAIGAFNTEMVELGHDTDDDPITTLLIKECDPDEARAVHVAHASAPPTTRNETIALRTLERAMEETPITARVFDGGVEGLVVRVDDWRACFYREGMPGADQRTKRKAFQRAVEGLLAKGLIGVHGDLVWPKGARH